MLKMFYSGTYNTRHELINKYNAEKMLKDDLRSKIVGDVKKTLYSQENVILKNNPNVVYIGGFYYEKQNPKKTLCENVVYEELKQIDNSDIVIVNLTNYSAIATVTELIYAATRKKKIVIFCNPKITSYQVEGEYWFPILTSKELDEFVDVIFVEDENEIIKYINNLK